MKPHNNIALIFFSRSTSDEARQKSWFKEKSKNQSLAKLLIERASAALQSSGIPVYHITEEKQKGNSFGERLANAYEEIFELGYDQVISVGNDCPELKNIDWNEITQQLSLGKSVLGADKRGGAYLIGLQKSSFDKSEFQILNWQTNSLYEELKRLCQKETAVQELSKLRDINSFHDILLASAARKSDTFFRVLARLVQSFHPLPHFFQKNHHDSYLFKDTPLRAPPIYKVV